MNKTAGIVWYFKGPNGWDRKPVVRGKEGRIKQGVVMIDGKEHTFPQGRFQIRSYVGRKVVYENVSNSVIGTFADGALVKKIGKLRDIAAGKALPARSLAQMAKAYVKDCHSRQALEAAEDAQRVLDEFLSLRRIAYPSDVRRDDVLAFHKALRGRGLSDRTVANKDARLRSFLRFAGVKSSTLPPKPKYERKLVTVYDAADVTALLNVADGELGLALEMALKLGLREQELMFAEWGDVHWQDATFRVQGKPHWGFKVKDSEQREVPIPADLLYRLEEWHARRPDSRLILGTENDKPNGHFLRALKRLAKREGLNCGACAGCTGPTGECRQFTLHKLRRTYATTLLRNGLDVRTVQAYAGHADLETTLRYLRPASSRESQEKINAITWGQ